MTACFHLPGVQCDYCRTALRDDRPYVATVTTGGTYFSSQDFLDALRRVEIERDEARREVSRLTVELAIWRKNAEYACENPPEDCDCPGCSLAREDS